MTTLYGIKNCDTVKKARKWLDAENIAYQFHDFRADGIDSEKITEWANTLGLANLVNKRSTTWKQLDDLQKQVIVEEKIDEATALITASPTLIKRPVLESKSGVQVGFNAENYTATFK